MNDHQKPEAQEDPVAILKKDFYKNIIQPKKQRSGKKSSKYYGHAVVTVRMSPELHQLLKDRAKESRLSMNAYCVYMLFLKAEDFPLESE